MEDLYASVHRAIRAAPQKEEKKEKRDWKAMDVRLRTPRLTREERVQRLSEKIAAKRQAAADAAAAAAAAAT